ncbi:MAG: DUF885 family protein [Woeseia sp.]
MDRLAPAPFQPIPVTPQTAEDLVDRIAVWPGQLTAYDTGGLEIFALRKQAEERLGDTFDIREFHDRILENGALPLGALREHVEAWIAEKQKSAHDRYPVRGARSNVLPGYPR